MSPTVGPSDSRSACLSESPLLVLLLLLLVLVVVALQQQPIIP